MHYPTPPTKGGLAWGVTLTNGKTNVFCLELRQHGYTLTTPDGMMEANKADKIAALVRDFPVRVSIEPLDEMTAGQSTAIRVSISNVGKWPVEYQSLRLTGRVATKIPPPDTASRIDFESDPPMSYLQEPKSTIEPGQTTRISLLRIPKIAHAAETGSVTAGKQFAVQVVASVYVKILGPEDKSADRYDNLPITEGFYATTPWRASRLLCALK